jgi:hypothetical protein
MTFAYGQLDDSNRFGIFHVPLILPGLRNILQTVQNAIISGCSPSIIAFSLNEERDDLSPQLYSKHPAKKSDHHMLI